MAVASSIDGRDLRGASSRDVGPSGRGVRATDSRPRRHIALRFLDQEEPVLARIFPALLHHRAARQLEVARALVEPHRARVGIRDDDAEPVPAGRGCDAAPRASATGPRNPDPGTRERLRERSRTRSPGPGSRAPGEAGTWAATRRGRPARAARAAGSRPGSRRRDRPLRRRWRFDRRSCRLCASPACGRRPMGFRPARPSWPRGREAGLRPRN
jgi:hypothetical protein